MLTCTGGGGSASCRATMVNAIVGFLFYLAKNAGGLPILVTITTDALLKGGIELIERTWRQV